jgi:hypothetical protein
MNGVPVEGQDARSERGSTMDLTTLKETDEDEEVDERQP